MKIRPLSPHERLMYDATGRLTRNIEAWPKEGVRYNLPPRYVLGDPQDLLQKFMVLLKSNQAAVARHYGYYEYSDEMYGKTGPQGGTFSLDRYLKNLEPVYSLAQGQETLKFSIFERGRDILIGLIREKLSFGFIPQDVYLPIYKTAASVPTGRKKGDFLAETVGFSLSGWNHVWPDFPGQRIMRNKLRNIHQDSIINVRGIEPYLAKARYWLRREFPEFFGAWMDPSRHIRPTLTKLLSREFVSIEGDYEQMDAHVTLRIVQEIVLPVYEQILDPGEFLHLASYIEEAFNQPLFLGKFIIEGLHNLFSGQGITNDFETILTVALELGVLDVLHVHYSDALILAQGDDLVLAGSPKILSPGKVMGVMLEASNAAGLEMHKEKCRISQRDVRFCREVYYPAGKRDQEGILFGAYPTVLAVNNIFQPEKLSASPGLAVIANLSRLDGCIGAPDYSQTVQFCLKYLDLRWSWTEQDLQQYHSVADWWERLYGIRYDPSKSPTYQLIQKLNVKIRRN